MVENENENENNNKTFYYKFFYIHLAHYWRLRINLLGHQIKLIWYFTVHSPPKNVS